MAHSGALTEMPQGFNRLGGSLPNEFLLRMKLKVLTPSLPQGTCPTPTLTRVGIALEALGVCNGHDGSLSFRLVFVGLRLSENYPGTSTCSEEWELTGVK